MTSKIETNLSPETEVLTPSEAGCKFLGSLGLDAESLGSIMVAGARPGCEGSVAEYVGNPEHERAREQFTRMAETAKSENADLTQAVIEKIDFLIVRDDNNEIVRVAESPTAQKKT